MQKRFLQTCVACFLFLLATIVYAQPSRQGLPASLNLSLPDIKPTVVSTDKIDWKTVKAEDQLALSQNLPLRAGFSLPVVKSIDNDGEWTQLPDGRMLWRLKLEAPSAVSLGVVFDMFLLPEGAELYLYNEDKSFIIGAFTSENNNPNNVFSTHLIPGSSITIEYIEKADFSGAIKNNQIPITLGKEKIQSTKHPEQNKKDVKFSPKGVLRVGELIYVYNDKVNTRAKDLGEAGSCQVNINCIPEGDNWQEEKRGVARIFFREGTTWYYCSGTLVNNTLEDGTPYFLTAYHCGATASAADHNVWQFYFNYERPGCANTGTPPNNMITGCVKRAEGSISGGTDMQLVELNSTPNLAWNPYYNGWDKSGNTTTGGVSIHHPSGDAKKISTFTGTTYSTTWSGGATNGHWRFPSWAATPNGQGVTEGGSSGSPLFNNAGRVIGTLTGGSSDCSNPSGDVYGKFSVHWQSAVNGTGNAYELKHWLDPAGTNPTTLDGMDPNAVSAPPVADFTATPINVAAGQAVQFNDRSTNLPQEWSWTFANGFPSSSTQRNPTCVWANPGTYTVSLTAKNKYGQDTETKTAYITVTGYTPPTSPKTIGGGTSTAANFPYGSAFLYKSVRSASIYTGDEIGGSGIIKQIAYYPTSSKSDSRKIKIYMKEVDYSTFSTAETVDAITANATLVLDGTFKPTPGGTWFTHTLQTPFEYNSAKNLLVVVVVDATSTGSSNCRYTAKTGAHQQWAGNTAPTGNGTINANRPNIRITIDPYVAPVANFGVEAYMFFEGFEGGVIPAGWTTNDVDGDGYNWFVDTSGASKTHSGKGAIVSASWLKDVGALTPNNWLITPAIDLSNTSDSYDLKYYVIGQDPSYSQEHYGVYVSTTGTNPANFTLLFEETLPSGMQEYEARKISLNAYKGNSTVYIAFRHFNSSDVFRINLDDVGVLSKLLQPTQVDVYEGEKLSLFDLSTNNPTLWKWSNPSGIPTESYVQNPDVQYNVQGVYDVSLTAANPAGSSSKTKTNYVNVIGRAPIADFYGQGNLRNIDLRPFIPIGGTVAYEEMSSRVPTAWNWAFTGGSPSTFSGKIPVDITYSSPGKYAASLTATNAHGTDTYTIPDFVVVGGKDTCTNLYPGDRLTAWGLTNGLIPGHAASGTTKFFQYAEYYDNQYAGKISGIQFYCYKAKGTGKNVTWYIWDGSTGSPGTVLWDSVITITSFTEEAWNFISMADVAVSGPFFIGYSLNYDATHNYDNHQFCTVGAKRDIDYSTAFISLGTTSPGTWVSTLDILDLSTSWVIHPEFTYDFTGTIVTATATPGCESGSVTLTSTKSTNQTYYLITGTGTPVANWTGTTNSHTFTGLASGDYKGYVVESGVTSLTSNLATLTNDTKVNVSVSISASPSTAICEGTSVTFTATPTNGGTSPTYKWYEGGVLSGETTNTFTTSTLTNGEGVYCVLTSDLSCVVSSTATSNTINTTVNPNKPVSVSIAANSGTTICAGTSVTFTATPTNGGSNPTYQWKVNGGNVGSNSATYTSSTLSNNDNVTCVLTSNATCATGSPATSNSLKMTVNPNLPVSVIISADPGTTICAGESVKFTANPTNGGSSPTYQWYVNGVSVGTGATYTTTSLANGNKVTCVLTSNATCATGSPATSNELTMTVNPKQTVSVSISANPSTAICEGTSVTFTANPTNGGTSPTYKWYEGGVLSSETTNEFTTTTLTNGEGVYCVLTSDLSCVVSSTATSNTINTTVNPNKPVS
ncbi:MAG: PKD domain-containing protein, partial [Bacteroidales bacterium]|nr:PKD domain-containing protein [Bacteroidales bacterium]